MYPTKAPIEFIEPLDPPTECGLFSHVLVYFLLGPKQVQVAPVVAAVVDPKAKGKANAASITAPTVEAIGDPILTKVVLFKPHVMALERSFRNLREKLREANAKDWSLVVTACGMNLGELLSQLASLLKDGFITPKDEPVVSGAVNPTVTSGDTLAASIPNTTDGLQLQETTRQEFELQPVSDSRPYPVVKFMAFESAGICLVPLQDECIAKLADLLTFVRDVDAVIDNDICTFFRAALGYSDN